MYAVLGYKDRLCDLAQGDPTAGDTSFWDDLALPGKPTVTQGTGPIPIGNIFQLLCTNGTGVGQRNAFKVEELDDGWMHLPSLLPWDAPDGYRTYLSCHDGRVGIRYVPDDAPGPDETFQLVSLSDDDAIFAIRTSQNTFLTAEHDGNGSPLACDRTTIGEWERFMFVQVPKELVPEEPPMNVADHVRTGVAEAQSQAVAGAAGAGAKPDDVASQTVQGIGHGGLRDQLFRPRPGRSMR